MNERMTKRRRDDGDTPFGEWLRYHPALQSRFGYDAQNGDYFWFQYVKGWLMFLEEKRGFNNESDPAQQDTHGIVDQALRFACGSPDFQAKRFYKTRTTHIKYFGYFLIQFEHTSPDDGDIRINHIPVSKDQFLRFLRFQWFPSSRSQRESIGQEIREKLNEIQEALDKYANDDVYEFERGMMEAERILSTRDYDLLEGDEHEH